MKQHWYQKKKLKHVTAFLTEKQRRELKRIVKETSELTLTRYVTTLLVKHIEEKKNQEAKPNMCGENCKNFNPKVPL